MTNLPTVDTVDEVQPYLRDHEERIARLERMVRLAPEPALAWDAGAGSPRFIAADLVSNMLAVGEALLEHLNKTHDNNGSDWADKVLADLCDAFDTQLDELSVALSEARASR